VADRGGAGGQGHPSPRRFFTRSTKLIGQVARPPIVEQFLPGGWGPGFSPLGVSTNGLSQTRRLLHVRSQPAALTAGRVSCRLSSRDTLHRQTRFLQRRRGFASRFGWKPHSLDFAHLKRAPGLASQPYNAYRSDKTDVRALEPCSGLDGGPRGGRVRKGGFIAVSIAAGWPERRRL